MIPSSIHLAPKAQAELHASITTGKAAKVKQFIQQHPELLNEPFENGSLPLHVAINSHRRTIAQALITMNADSTKKDSKNLDALDHAFIAGEQKIAKAILKNISKTTPTIRARIIFLHELVQTAKLMIEQENSVLPQDALEAYKKQKDVRDAENLLPVERAIRSKSLERFVMLFVLGADLNAKSREGQSLLHLALHEEQIDIAHLLLIARLEPTGLDPNEKDASNQTLLSLAATKGNMPAVYLLLAYGATLSDPILKIIEQTATARDPLHISSSDSCYFLSTIAYWLCRGCIGLYPSNTYLDNLPTLIHLLGTTWVLYQQLPITHAIGLLSLEMLPATNIAMQAWRASSVALSAFFGMQTAWESCSERPKKAMQKGIVHAANTLQSLYTLQQTIATEYASSQGVKALLQCTNITSDDIAAYESMPPEQRMEQIVLHSNAAACPPLIELAFPSWNCDTFKKLYREEAFKHHPDKNKDGSSTIQIVLNAAKSLWSSRCEK